MRKAILILAGIALTSAAYAMPTAPVQPDGLAQAVRECRADEGMRRDAKGNCVFDNAACYRRCLKQRYGNVGWCRTSCKYNGN
jgi:hypothetical protein